MRVFYDPNYEPEDHRALMAKSYEMMSDSSRLLVQDVRLGLSTR
ncbi:hypothetical protein ID866_6615 [Astraeus odoratus]|nr:hypothetical protein ID866_6615 [Astraeus odoratus]